MLACVQVVVTLDLALLLLVVDREHLQLNHCTARGATKVPLHVDVKLHKEVLQAFEWNL
jgi:hypothetical protein